MKRRAILPTAKSKESNQPSQPTYNPPVRHMATKASGRSCLTFACLTRHIPGRHLSLSCIKFPEEPIFNRN
jgi:hypothetical protein